MAGLNVMQQAVPLPAACQGVAQVFAVPLSPAVGPPAAMRECLRHAVHQSMCSTLAEALQSDVRQLSVLRAPGRAPVLRLGWMVLPDNLIDPVLAAAGGQQFYVNAIDQLTMADFVESGQYDKHIRRMRNSYRRRRDALACWNNR